MSEVSWSFLAHALPLQELERGIPPSGQSRNRPLLQLEELEEDTVFWMSFWVWENISWISTSLNSHG
jgi:hypothetical protein